MLKVATALPHEPYREYKDVERVYSGSTEIDKILDKNGNVLFAVNKEVEGTPALTFKGKEETNLKNYRIYGNTETKTRSYSGSAPLSFPIEDGSVSNYRIYGNTVNGESMGDKTVNILPLSRTPITETHGDFLCEYDGLGTITLTTDKDNATTDGEFVIPLIQDFTIPVSIGQGGTGCLQINNSISGIATNNIKLYYNNTQIDTWNLNELNRVLSAYMGMSNKTIDSISVRINDSGTNRKITIKPAFVENVTEQVPFEPYGYRIPITNNSETANIYLDEPLTKSADNADYIDYAEQKRYNADGTSEDVTLPTLPAQSSTNTLSVGTAVQPSSVAVDVDEVVSCGNKTRNLFDGEFLQGYWAYADGVWVQANTWITTKKIPCKSSTTYAFSFNQASRWYGFVWFDFSGNYISYNAKQNSSSIQYRSFSAVSPPNAAYMAINVAGYPETVNTIFPNDITDFMLVEGSTALPYEPYGYKVPVTVSDGTDTLTTPIYLPEQIKMVGDEAEYVDYGEQKQHRVRKNLLPNNATSQTKNGVAFTVNNDGSVTCNGTARDITFFVISSEAFSLPVGRYKLNGAPTGGGQNYNFKLDVRVSTSKYYPDTGNGGQLSILQGEPITLSRIVIYSGYTCNNLTFYPMIRKADIEDDTYEPYIENTDLDVTLPALPVLPGTNTLTVGTEVQPSNIHLKGRIKEVS